MSDTMASLNTPVEPLLNLNRIPKTKEAIDYVRIKLAQNKSEEAISFINKILELYYTSPGFNALQLSKVRIKRMKATHYKEMLLSLDEELKSILNEEDFKSVVNLHQINNEDILDKTIKLSEDLAVHPTYSMLDEADELEALVTNKNEPELLLYLFKKNRDYYGKSVTKDNLSAFLNKYDLLFNQVKNNYLRTKLGFVLNDLEQDKNEGVLNPAKAEELLKHFESALLEEADENNKVELLLNILRSGALLPDATLLLKSYITVAESLVQSNKVMDNATRCEFIYLIAQYDATASRPYRLKLLSEHEELTAVDDTVQKLKNKICRGMVYLHFGDFDDAKKNFNAAEHLILKTSWKHVERKNGWGNLCYWRKFIFAEMIFNKDPMYNPTMFNDLEKIIQDTSYTKQSGFQTKCEIEALKYFVSHRWNDAKEKYKIANQYYDGPYYPLDYYFNLAMLCILEEKNESKYTNKLKSSESLFFSTTAITILSKAKTFYKEHKTSDYFDNHNYNQDTIHL
ncbi:MAG: hypothetical protein ACKOX3_08635 [Bacteroidota bacterium]